MKNNPSSAAEKGAINSDSATQSAARPHIDTEPFKKWFGNSQVVDAKGAPLVVYHGTTSDFTDFSDEYFGEGNGNADFGDGFYFACNAAAASNYAAGLGGNVMPVYLKIDHPADLEIMLSTEVQDNMQDAMGGDATKDVLAAMGYDGIIIDHGKDGKEYVVFDGMQIKSATGNSGLYLRDSSSLTDNEAVLTLANAASAKAHIDEVFSREAGSTAKGVRP